MYSSRTDKPELLDYVVFFEAEPEWVHADGWYYGARFTTTRGQDRIVATIAPMETEFAFDWWQGQELKLRLRSVLARYWILETSQGRESLHIAYTNEREQLCRLQLKPQVFVEWSTTWGGGFP